MTPSGVEIITILMSSNFHLLNGAQSGKTGSFDS